MSPKGDSPTLLKMEAHPGRVKPLPPFKIDLRAFNRQVRHIRDELRWQGRIANYQVRRSVESLRYAAAKEDPNVEVAVVQVQTPTGAENRVVVRAR